MDIKIFIFFFLSPLLPISMLNLLLCIDSTQNFSLVNTKYAPHTALSQQGRCYTGPRPTFPKTFNTITQPMD